MVIHEFGRNRIKEVTVVYRNKKYIYPNSKQQGMPAFERCVELGWLDDKMAQVPDLEGSKLFDFGCNKAAYIQKFKEQHNLQKTYGIDIKKQGKNFVDRFFHGSFNNPLAQQIKRRGTFRVATAISAVEHAGCAWRPDEARITEYQQGICGFLMQISEFFFLTVPFGRRPGWASDNSRKNLYQFDPKMLKSLKRAAHNLGKKYTEEIYKFDNGYWVKSSKDDARRCRYRSKKSGASAVALVSVFSRG